MRKRRSILSGLRRGSLRDDSGSGTVEFVILFPFLMSFIFSFFELGFLTARMVMLERGFDITMREFRLGQIDFNNDPIELHRILKKRICDRAAILSDCENSMMVEMIELGNISSTFTAPVSGSFQCVNRVPDSVQPTLNMNTGTNDTVMFVRVCVVVDPIAPWTSLGAALPKDASGGVALIATSAFANEPS